MASNEQQWDTHTSRSKQQIRQNKRRERAQRMLMQAQQRECADSSVGSPGGILHSHGLNSSGFPASRVPAFSNNSCQESNDDDDSEASHHQEDNQTKRPVKFQMTKSGSSPTSKLVGEPLYEEDVIDGFAIVSFTSYEDLEAAVRIAEKTSCLPDPLVPLDTKERIRPSPSKRSRKSSGRSNGTVKNRSSLESSTSQQPSVSNVNGPGAHVNEKLEAAIDSGSRDSRGTSIDRFSDVSRHSNSSRGYLCDSESEENDKNVNNQELRGHSPTTAGSIRPVAEFVAPVKQRPFSPAHAGLNPNTSQCSSSSNAAGENGGNNLRWVGFSGSPRPATAVAPHGHFQNGPRLSDCQPTEGGAGPSPAPPAAPSPRLGPHPPIAGSPLNSFPLSSPSSNSVPIIRNEFNLHPIPFTAPSSSPSLSSSGPPALSYIAPPFYSSAGQRPPSTDSKPSGGPEGQRRTPTLPSVLSNKLPPPPGPLVKPPSPFLSSTSPATGNLRPGFSMTAPPSVASSSQSALVPPSSGPPPPVFTSSSYPFFPPVSMMRTSTSSSSHSAASFLAPSPPTSGLPQPRHSSLGPPPPLTFGEQPFALTNRTPYSTPSSTTFPLNSTKLSTPSSERPASDLNSSSSRPASRAAGSEPTTRTGSLPFPGHLTSRRSPSLPGPPPSLATFSSPISSWPRPPAPDPIANRQFCPSPKTSSSPTVRSTSGSRQSPPKEPLSLVSVKSVPVSSSSSISQMSSESYSDMLRQELNSRFLNSTPGMSSILPPPPTPGVNKLLDSSSLYRPMMPPLGHGLPGLGTSPYPAPPLPSHSTAYGLTSTAPQLTVSSSAGQPSSTGGGIISNLSALGLPTASSNNPSLPLKSKPGKWNAMHVRIAWEIYQNQQRHVRDPHSDPKRALNLNLTPKLIGPASNQQQPGLPPPSVPPLPPVKLPGGFADPLPSPHNLHNNPYGFSHHNVGGFLPRMPSVPNQQQHSTTPPSHPSIQPPPGGVRSSPAPDQWNRLPHSSPAPWLAPLMNAGPISSMKVEPPASSSSSAAATAHHHQQQQQAQKERDRQRKEEREKEKERERERAREKERERNERQEREREKKREEEREKRRHASRSPLHQSRPSTNGAPSKNELSSSSSSKSSASAISVGSSLSGALPPLPTFHPGMQMPSAAMVERSRLGLPLSSAGLYGQPYDPFMRMDPLSIEREQREFLSRFGASASHLAGLGAPSLYGHGPSPSSADRYPYGLGAGLPPDRYRDGGLPLPPHLSHHLAGSLGLSLAGQQSGVSLNDRYGPIPGMSGSALYPPTSTGYPFPPLGPSSLLGSGLGPGMSSLPILPPSMLSSSGSGKRSPPPPSPAPSSNSLAGGPLSNTSALASIGRSHMGMGMGLPPGLGLPYPMPSPSPMLNQHLLPSLGSSLGGGARSGSSATPPVVGGRPMLDLTSPHQQPPGLTPFNPLDPFPRKDDPQSR